MPQDFWNALKSTVQVGHTYLPNDFALRLGALEWKKYLTVKISRILRQLRDVLQKH
jgi:hypothetical protein